METIRKHPLFNIWRGFRYTAKGQKVGFSEEWKYYNNFFNDTIQYYIPNYRLVRKDKTKPFSKNNFIFLPEEEVATLKNNIIKITYNNETHTIQEWADILEKSVMGIRTRYHNNKNYTIEEILFGKKRLSKRNLMNPKELKEADLKKKASKMLSSYKLKDWKKDLQFNLDREWFIENILKSKCIYCGDTNNLGCDRIDNNKGHTYDNVVPCCYTCNIARGNNFSFEEMKILGKTIKEIKENRT